MAAVPSLPTIGVGVLPSSQMSQIVDAVNFLLNPPILRLRQTVAQNITTGGSTQPVTFTVEDVDSANMHDNTTNPSRATAAYPGWYRLGGGISWTANATNRRNLGWAINGAAVNGSDTSIQGFAGLSNRQDARSILVFLNVGDYVELMAFQDSGITLATDVTTTAQPSMDLTWEHS